jgi:hypothetical protein
MDQVRKSSISTEGLIALLEKKTPPPCGWKVFLLSTRKWTTQFVLHVPPTKLTEGTYILAQEHFLYFIIDKISKQTKAWPFSCRQDNQSWVFMQSNRCCTLCYCLHNHKGQKQRGSTHIALGILPMQQNQMMISFEVWTSGSNPIPLHQLDDIEKHSHCHTCSNHRSMHSNRTQNAASFHRHRFQISHLHMHLKDSAFLMKNTKQ